MADITNPEVSAVARPNAKELAFDVEQTLRGIVGLRSHVPEEALTAAILGTERAGHGALINDDGLIVTIGYLITEAESVWLTDHAGRTVGAHVVGYDPDSGIGLVQALHRLELPALALGDSTSLRTGEAVIAAAQGGLSHALQATVSDRREFAGYWEYVLDEAIFTTPAHPSWGGAALLGLDGRLLGVGSLLVQSESDEHTGDCNMFVPIDLLKAVMDDMLRYGRPGVRPKPWMGVFVYDMGDQLVVAGVFKDCPAHRADLRPGDRVVEVQQAPVGSLAELFRSVWALGDAGVEIPLTIVRDSARQQILIHSEERGRRLHSGTVH